MILDLKNNKFALTFYTLFLLTVHLQMAVLFELFGKAEFSLPWFPRYKNNYPTLMNFQMFFDVVYSPRNCSLFLNADVAKSYKYNTLKS